MLRKTLLPLFLMAVMIVTVLLSCSEQAREDARISQADSLMNEAYKNHDYEQLLAYADQFQASGEFAEMKADYWRGYAYSRQRKMRLAENWWKKATALDIHTGEDLEYYAKSANRLAGFLLFRGEYEATMKVAVPAMKVMEEAVYDQNSDYAYLQTTVGCCQLNIGNLEGASQAFHDVYRKYQDLIQADPSKTNFTSAIIGVITITDNYLMQKNFEEAYDWTAQFDELLCLYRKLPAPDYAFLDKQQARLNLYKACALEGLGRQKGAAEAYQEAMKTDYAKTDDGRLEAINYLMAAKRWTEASKNYEVLDNVFNQYGIGLSMETFQRYLLPKYRANMEAQQTESAIAVSSLICNRLDSAIIGMKKDEAAELTAIYNMQEKETEIAQQKADMARQRYVATIVAFVLIIIFFVLFTYYRHQAARRLQTAYHQLEIANEHAEESSRMKTSFIQQISHEIRTPLNILSGFTQVVTTPDITLDEESKKEINEKILENTNRITTLVNKMLELSDVSSKTVIECNDQVLAIQIAAQAVSNFPTEGEGLVPISLDVDEAANDAMLQTNEQGATRVLVLLLDNARRYTKEGHIRLLVGKKDGVVRFTVEDTGIGVPPNEAEHIFQEFVQLNEYAEGTGIGLTVARSIARRLGGDVVLDTRYTGGARFVMTHPVLQA